MAADPLDMFWSVFVYTWAHLGFYMLILLAGLRAIPADLYEAAEMDGTPPAPVDPHYLAASCSDPVGGNGFILDQGIPSFEELYALNVRWQSLVAYIFETSGLRGQMTMHGLGLATASLLVAVA